MRRGNLIEIGKRAKQIDEIEGQYMGLLKFTPQAWRAVEACSPAWMPRLATPWT